MTQPPINSFTSLNQLLKEIATEPEGICTHTSVTGGKYTMNRDYFPRFYELYVKAKYKHITEMSSILSYSMFRVDIDIAVPKDDYKNEKRFYTEDNIKILICSLQAQLRKSVHCNDSQLVCSFFEKDIYEDTKKNRMKGGLHLQFPHIFIESKNMWSRIIKPISQEIKDATGFEFDDVYKAPWLLYGSTKSRDTKPYILSKNYNIDYNEMTVFETFQNYKLFDIKENQIEITPENVDYLLPQIMSIIPFNRECLEYKPEDRAILHFIDEPKRKPKINDNRDVEEKLVECKLLMRLLSSDRCDDYKQWLEVGWCLFNISEGCDEGLQIWDDWSRISDKYDSGSCDEQWSRMNIKENGLLIGSLKKWAKEDCPYEYNRLFCKKNVDENVEPPSTHYDIGLYMVRKIKEYGEVYYWDKKKRIYVYNNDLKIFEENVFEVIMKFIPIYMIPLIEKYGDTVSDLLSKSKKNEQKNYEDKIKKNTKLLKECKSTPFLKSVLTQIQIHLTSDDKFIEKNFNRVPYLFPISDNKVINFKTSKVCERTKEHYFTFTTDNIFEDNRPNKDWVYKYFSEILKTENKDFITSVLTWFGYCLTGENCIKRFPVLTGDGDNGKTAFFNVIKSIIGEFGIIGNDKVFLKQKSQSNHSDEYLPLIGKRFAYLSEIDKESSFNEKLIKSITGNDGDISLRGCGGKTIEVIIDCKLLCICNGDDIPDFKDKQGFTNRLMIIPFKNKFSKNPAKIIEINSMKNAIFTELCYYVKEHFYDNKMNINFSIEIEDETNKVKDNKDTIKNFMHEKIEITDVGIKDNRIKKDVLHQAYMEYCMTNSLKDIMVSKTEFYNSMNGKYNLQIYREREYKGIKFRSDELDDSEPHTRLL